MASNPRVWLQAAQQRVGNSATFICDFCGYPDDSAEHEFWRCSLCGCEDADQVSTRTDAPKAYAALTAVLDLLDECESFYGSVLFDGTPMPTIVGTDEVRRTIEKHLTKEDA